MRTKRINVNKASLSTDVTTNVFDRYFTNDRYFSPLKILFFTFSSRRRQRRRQQHHHLSTM